MADPATLLILTATGAAGLCLISAAALKGWQGWLELKRTELQGRGCDEPRIPSPVARIELADLKERVRRLEAIASGTDL